MRLSRIAAVLWIWLAALPLRAGEVVTVFAAASLKTALDEVAALHEQHTGTALSVSYAGSSALARQIQFGAPADVFVSANAAWMDALASEALLAEGTRRDLLSNRLVLIAPAGGKGDLPLGPGTDLGAALGPDGRLAMALVDAVPAGIYGREALTGLGIWDSVAGSIAQTDNARAALRLVALGEAPLGLVYATDARSEPRVRVVSTVDPALHTPIVYPAAVLREGDSSASRGVLSYLASPPAQTIFRKHGFISAGPDQ